MLKKRKKALAIVLLILTVVFSCMLPLLSSKPNTLPSLTAEAADAATGVKIKRYASFAAFEKDYPTDAYDYHWDLQKDADYSAYQVVVSQETSGENFAIFFDAKRYPQTLVTDTMFSNFGIQYCKYLNSLKAISGVSHGVLNIFIHMLHENENGLGAGWWDGSCVNTNEDYTEQLITAIMQCTTTDFYASWCLLHETSHSYGEGYFSVHSETSVNIRSFAAVHAMGNGKAETDPHFRILTYYDSSKDKFPAATVSDRLYSSDLYFDSFITHTFSGINSTFYQYKSLDEVDPSTISDIIYGNCNTFDVCLLSANTGTNLFRNMNPMDAEYKKLISTKP